MSRPGPFMIRQLKTGLITALPWLTGGVGDQSTKFLGPDPTLQKLIARGALLSLLIVLAPLSSLVSAQERQASLAGSGASVNFENLTRKDGVTDSEIRNVIEDEQGRIWFGTRYGGVNIYNGYDIRVYAHDPSDPHSLAGDPAFSLYKDSQGTIWVSTLGAGLSKYDPETESFTNYQHNPQDPSSIWHDSVQFTFEDRDGNFWVAAANGLDKMDRETGTFTHYSFDPDAAVAPSSQNIKIFYQDQDGGLWLGLRRGGLRRIDPETGEVTHAYVHDPGDPDSISDDNVFAILEDHTGTFWVGTWQGLDILDRETGKFTHIEAHPEEPNGLSNRRIFALLEDSQHRLWIGTGVGLNRYDHKTGKFTRFFNDLNDPNSLAHNEVLFLYEDSSGILWISTLAGLSKLDLNPPKFASYRAIAAPGSLNSDDVEALLEDRQGRLWMAAAETLNLWNPETKTFRQYQANFEGPKTLGYIDDIFEDRQGQFWLGTQNGLFQFDPERGEFRRFQEHPNYPIGEEILQIEQEKNTDHLWLNVQGVGLKKLDPETGVILEHYAHDPHDFNSISDDYIRYFNLDLDEVVWIASEGGLDRLETKRQQITRFSFHPQGKLGRDPSNDIHHIGQSSNGKLWIATSAGLNQFSPETGEFIKYTTLNTQKGLPSNFIKWTIEDSQGKVWIGTNSGLVKFDPQENTFRTYDVTDGLTGIGISSDVLKTSWGNILFVSKNRGVNAFNPAKLEDNQYVPPVILTNFYLSNQIIDHYGRDSVLPRPINLLETLYLNHNQSDFAFDFAALNYRKPDQNLYQFKLEGFDQSWSPISKNHSATYTNLNPGHYTFRVKGSNNDGVWNQVGASLDIVIAPPWWATWFFKIVSLTATVGLMLGAYRWRLRTIRQQNRRLEQQVDERTNELKASEEALRIAKERAEAASRAKSTFLANMSHELRTPLNGILGYAQILQRTSELPPDQRQKVHTIEQSGNHLLTLINDVLNISKIEAGKITLSPQAVELHPFLTAIASIIRIRAEQKSLQFRTDFSADLPASVHIDEKRLRQVLINLLGNAVKFTEQGQVIFAVHRLAQAPSSPCGLRFSVQDSGIGIPEAEQAQIFQPFYQVEESGHQQQGTGLGLSISQHLAQLMGGTIQISSVPEEGSTFWVDLYLSVEETATSRNSPEHLPIVGYQGMRKTILVVDDDRTNRDVLRDALAPLGFAIAEAEDGFRGLEQAHCHPPDLILLDFRMPRLNGRDMVTRLRQDQRLKTIPIIVVSASTYDQDKQNFIESGCDDFLPKPINIDHLLRAIAHLLDLEWIQPSIPAAAESSPNQPDDSELKLPPAETLEHLRNLALMGDISEIRVQLKQLDQADSGYRSFVVIAQKLVEQFQLVELQTFFSQRA